jgi:DivIVA domain-containing protein
VVDFLVLVVATLVVGGLLFLGGSMLLGRGETQPPAELDRSPVELPDDRQVTADDVRGLQMSVALRGYRMTEVDWLLDQFAQTLDERDEEIARLRARLSAATRPSPQPRPPEHENGHEQSDDDGGGDPAEAAQATPAGDPADGEGARTDA